MDWRQVDEPNADGSRRGWRGGCALGCLWSLAILVAVLVLALLLIKFLWEVTVPDLFPGAVDKGLIAKEIGWWTAFKLAIFIAVVAAITGIRRR